MWRESFDGRDRLNNDNDYKIILNLCTGLYIWQSLLKSAVHKKFIKIMIMIVMMVMIIIMTITTIIIR